MKIVLTGGTGFIGSNIYFALNSEYDIRVLTREVYSKIVNNVESEEDLKLFECVDVVIHTASIVGEKKNVKYEEYYKINILGTRKLLKISNKYGVLKFIHLSTGGVYADSDMANIETKGVSGHKSKYILSKLLSEVECQKYKNELGIIILRLFFPFGVNQSTGLLKTLYNKVISNGEVLIHRENKPLLSMIHIDEFIRILQYFLEGNILGVFNVAGNNSICVSEIVNIIADECNINKMNCTQTDTETSNYLSSNFKLLEKFKIEPFGIDLENDIRLTIKQWRQNNES